MNKMNKILTVAFLGTIFLSSYSKAGNEDRVGSAGASQLMINPWARSIGTADAGFANTNGLEAQFMNIAGLAHSDKTQIKFNMTKWLGTADINFYSAGLAQRINESSVFAISVQSMNFGEIPITTVELPEGGIGVFTPRLNVFNIGYAKKFSSSISGGINFKIISESIANLKANGVAIDAGIRYVTGEKDHIKFGIALKNVGPTMKYSGDGFAQQINYVTTGGLATLEQRSQSFEMPSLLNIGASYDFIFSESSKLVGMLGFTANSFSNDQYRLGFDYNLTTKKAAFSFRAGYVYEKMLLSLENRTNALTGITAGFSADVLSGKNKNPLGLEIAVRMAGPFGYVYTGGITIAVK
jgi:hypothetical protein